MTNVQVSAQRISSMLTNRNRTTADLAIAASLSVAPTILAAENTDVGFDDLVELGRYFKRPWSYFLIDAIETFDAAGNDNRSLGNRHKPVSAELLDEIEIVAEMLLDAAELFPETKFETPDARITPATPPETAGEVIRAHLGVTRHMQSGARDEFAGLRLWADALQGRGVYVSQRRLEDDTIRAFSRVHGAQAVVVVDTGDSAYARIFSLLHEYCHIVLRSAGLCDLSEHSTVERYCNAVAAAVLMPVDLIESTFAGRSFGGGLETDDSLLKDLGRELRVSQSALLIRLRDLMILDQYSYEALERRRASRRSDGSRTPGGTYYPPRINRVGRRYARNVLGSLDTGLINKQDASAMLEIGEHLLETYRWELERQSARGL